MRLQHHRLDLEQLKLRRARAASSRAPPAGPSRRQGARADSQRGRRLTRRGSPPVQRPSPGGGLAAPAASRRGRSLGGTGGVAAKLPAARAPGCRRERPWSRSLDGLSATCTTRLFLRARPTLPRSRETRPALRGQSSRASRLPPSPLSPSRSARGHLSIVRSCSVPVPDPWHWSCRQRRWAASSGGSGRRMNSWMATTCGSSPAVSGPRWTRSCGRWLTTWVSLPR